MSASCAQTLDILPTALDAMRFRPERIKLDPAIHAAEEATRLVVSEGIPFREADRRVAAKLKGLWVIKPSASQANLPRLPFLLRVIGTCQLACRPAGIAHQRSGSSAASFRPP